MNAHGTNYWCDPSTPIPEGSHLASYLYQHNFTLFDLSEIARRQLDKYGNIRSDNVRADEILRAKDDRFNKRYQFSPVSAKKASVEYKNLNKREKSVLKLKLKALN